MTSVRPSSCPVDHLGLDDLNVTSDISRFVLGDDNANQMENSAHAYKVEPASPPPMALAANPVQSFRSSFLRKHGNVEKTQKKIQLPPPAPRVSRKGRKKKKKKKVIKGQFWTLAEDSLLTRLVNMHGEKKWSTIAKMFNHRTGKQCRERWHNQLRPDIKPLALEHASAKTTPKGPKGSLQTPHSLIERDTVYWADHESPLREPSTTYRIKAPSTVQLCRAPSSLADCRANPLTPTWHPMACGFGQPFAY
ncbi:hypothetical protein Taro_036788 [Colocasia esculenta]|uniref:Uncharacterized protein n=1 Tax=Colocasia esculenta TaxID=4460 RepID=A0A843WIU4_COLES|nr:hypothetical protein [Colocasia esculenta]